MKLNNCLIELWIRFNPITAEGIKPVLEALQFNNTLERLQLPYYLDDVRRDIKSMEKTINKRRESHGSYVKLLIDFKSVIEFIK